MKKKKMHNINRIFDEMLDDVCYIKRATFVKNISK